MARPGVLVLCTHTSARSQVSEHCPAFPGPATGPHWSFDDPSAAEGTGEERLAVFRLVRDGIRVRPASWLASERAGARA